MDYVHGSSGIVRCGSWVSGKPKSVHHHFLLYMKICNAKELVPWDSLKDWKVRKESMLRISMGYSAKKDSSIWTILSATTMLESTWDQYPIVTPYTSSILVAENHTLRLNTPIICFTSDHKFFPWPETAKVHSWFVDHQSNWPFRICGQAGLAWISYTWVLLNIRDLRRNFPGLACCSIPRPPNPCLNPRHVINSRISRWCSDTQFLPI